jgi:hypothetical protein
VLVGAAVCPASPLLARPLTGADPVVPDLRQACLTATRALLARSPDGVAVIGVAAQAGEWPGPGELDLAAFAPALRSQATAGVAVGLPPPVPLGLGRMLLAEAGYTGPCVLHSVTENDQAAECAALGARLAARDDRVALLIMADGSARRTLRAPGYLDERSRPFDADVEGALRRCEFDALLALDAELARQVMATGRPALQVLAGAARGLRLTCEVRYADDPFGVFYLVATLLRPTFQRSAER